jgi:hypothetical protein
MLSHTAQAYERELPRQSYCIGLSVMYFECFWRYESTWTKAMIERARKTTKERAFERLVKS